MHALHAGIRKVLVSTSLDFTALRAGYDAGDTSLLLAIDALLPLSCLVG